MNGIYKRKGKVMHLAEAFYTNLFVAPILPYISKTKITPNMITVLNILNSFFIYFLSYKGSFVSVAILIQVYLFLDILDGNLARYKNMKSKIGAIMDTWNDRVFYTLIFIFIGWGRVYYSYIIITIILVNLYAIIPTFYIVPRLRKLKNIKRWGIKKYMFAKGFLIGMDLGTVDIILTIFLVCNKINIMFLVIMIGYAFDLIYRIIELKINENIERNAISI